jgi:hypothetical protein
MSSIYHHERANVFLWLVNSKRRQAEASGCKKTNGYQLQVLQNAPLHLMEYPCFLTSVSKEKERKERLEVNLMQKGSSTGEHHEWAYCLGVNKMRGSIISESFRVD